MTSKDIGGPAAQGVRDLPDVTRARDKLGDKAKPITGDVQPWERTPEQERLINPWELYSDHPQFLEATLEMDAAIEHAAKLPTWDTARAYMARFQSKWVDVGANDGEPRNHIVDRLNAAFGETIDYYCGRANPRP